MQRRIKTDKLRAVLFSRTSAAYSAGFASVYFALADVGGAALRLRGPRGTNALLDSIRPFVRRRWPETTALDVESADVAQAQLERREVVDILYVTLPAARCGPRAVPQQHRQACCHWCSVDNSDSGDAAASESSASSDESESESDSDPGSDPGSASASESESASAAKHDSSSAPESESDSDADSSSAPDSALSGADSVPKPTDSHNVAPNRGKLPVAPTTICFIIKAKQIQPVKWVLVVDCPSVEHIAAMEAHPHLQFACDKHRPSVAVHLTPATIAQDVRYKAWASRFQTNMFCRGQSHSPLRASAELVVSLHKSLPHLFPDERAPALVPRFQSRFVLLEHHSG